MIQQPARCGHQDVNATGQFLGLVSTVGAPHGQAIGVVVVFEELFQDAKCLKKIQIYFFYFVMDIHKFN